MLHELRISDLGVIDDAVLEPHAGFTVVTGETGAGKTMIVTALGLITGGRGDAARVRAGSDRAVVEARLAIDPAGTPASITAAAGGRLDEDGTVIAVRSVGADGRSRAHLGGRSVPLATLSELTDPLIAVHGQSEAISLLRPAQQRSVLDQFAGLDDDLRDYRALRAQWQQLAADLADRRARARERAQREQLLRLGLSEITAISPLPGEDVELIAEARRLENVDGLRTAAEIAVTALSGSEVLADDPTLTAEQRRDAVIASVRQHFKPEFVNRLDDMVVFDALSPADLRAIVDIQLQGLARRLADRRLVLEVTDPARDWLASLGYDSVYGARPLRRLVQTSIGDQLAKALLGGTIRDGDRVVVELADDKKALRVTAG